MKILIVFNHPAPYKVRGFNELAKYVDLDVVFERRNAKDRPKDFYNYLDFKFNAIFLKKGAFGKENSNTNELVKYLKKHHQEYDLIIMNGYSQITEMRAIKYLNKHHIKFVLMINGGVIKKENFIKRNIKKKFISSACAYLSPCLAADEYLKYYGAKIDNIYHYPYSTFYDEDVLSKPLDEKQKEIIRQKLHLPSGKIIMTSAQFIERKNNLFLLSIFKNRKETLLLIGSGPEKEKYIEYIKDNNMKNVIMLEFLKRDELFEIMRCVDGFITLSKEDIFGHTTLEAMANGLPVISSVNVISSKEYIDGKNGYLVHLDNIEEIHHALDNLNYNIQSAFALKSAKENTINKTGYNLYINIKDITKCE